MRLPYPPPHLNLPITARVILTITGAMCVVAPFCHIAFYMTLKDENALVDPVHKIGLNDFLCFEQLTILSYCQLINNLNLTFFTQSFRMNSQDL